MLYINKDGYITVRLTKWLFFFLKKISNKPWYRKEFYFNTEVDWI